MTISLNGRLSLPLPVDFPGLDLKVNAIHYIVNVADKGWRYRGGTMLRISNRGRQNLDLAMFAPGWRITDGRPALSRDRASNAGMRT